MDFEVFIYLFVRCRFRGFVRLGSVGLSLSLGAWKDAAAGRFREPVSLYSHPGPLAIDGEGLVGSRRCTEYALPVAGFRPAVGGPDR